MKNTVYIISGPAGVGKTTTSKRLVQELNRSAYISGDDVSHLPVKGRGKPWLDKETHDLTWKNILCLTQNLLAYDYDVVIDYVTFPNDVKWLIEQLANIEIRFAYVVLMVDKKTIMMRDQSRPEEVQMGERSLILLDEFENDLELKDYNKLYTQNYNEDQIMDIIEEILKSNKYIVT